MNKDKIEIKARLFPEDMGQKELSKLFKERAEASGAEYYGVKGEDELRALIHKILPKQAKVAVTFSPLKDLEYEKGALFDLDGAITGVDLAIAETGSIVLNAGQEMVRYSSLTSLTHIAIIKPGQIVPDLLDWASHMSGNQTLITGPSKTADIEIKLVIGVHGPERLCVIELL